MKIRLTFLFLIVLSAVKAQVQEVNRGYVRLSQQVISGNSFFDPDSQPNRIRTHSLYQTSLQAEYGFTKQLTGYVLFPFFVRSVLNEQQFRQTGEIVPGRALQSVGDAEIGVRFALRNQLPVKIIVYTVFGIPTGKKSAIGLETDLQTGDGEFNQMVGLQALHQFHKVQLSAFTAYNHRSESFSNEIRYGANLAWKEKHFSIVARFQAIESLFNNDAPVSQNGIFSNHREWFAPGVELTYSWQKADIFTSADFAVAGRNTMDATLWTMGVQYRW